MGNYPNSKFGPQAASGGGGGGGGIPLAGTNLITLQGSVDVVDAAGMTDPCVNGGTVRLGALLREVPSDATSFTFQTAGQAAAQTGLAIGDSVTLTNDAPTNGICDDVGTLVITIGVTGGTRDGVTVSTFILLTDDTNVCAGCGGP